MQWRSKCERSMRTRGIGLLVLQGLEHGGQAGVDPEAPTVVVRLAAERLFLGQARRLRVGVRLS